MIERKDEISPGWKPSSDFVFVLHTVSLAFSVSLNCMLWNTHTLYSFAVSHSASPSIAFCLGDPPSPLFLLFNAPFHCPSQSVWMRFPGLWTATSHLLSWSLFVLFFFPSIAFLMHFLSYAHSFHYIVLCPHAPCVFHKWCNSKLCLSLLFWINTMLV